MTNENPYEPAKTSAPGYRRKRRYSWRRRPWDAPGLWVLAVLFASGMAVHLASQWEVWMATRNTRQAELQRESTAPVETSAKP